VELISRHNHPPGLYLNIGRAQERCVGCGVVGGYTGPVYGVELLAQETWRSTDKACELCPYNVQLVVGIGRLGKG
jgi:hypothetical protein